MASSTSSDRRQPSVRAQPPALHNTAFGVGFSRLSHLSHLSPLSHRPSPFCSAAAEAGSVQLEFGYLGQATGKIKFSDAAAKSTVALLRYGDTAYSCNTCG